MKISVVVAVYQNEGSLSLTYEKVSGVFASALSRHDYELIFVDDGSKDGSLQEILSLRERDPHVKALTFTRNFGQMAAMLAGFKEATGDAVINISADLQDPVELIPQMVEKWESGAEIVVCYRTDRSDSLLAKLFSRVAYGVLRLSLPQIPPGGFDVVLMDRAVMDSFNAIDVRHRFFQGDLLWTGYRTSFIPYVRLERTIGRSQYNFAKKLKNFLDAVLDASYLPDQVHLAPRADHGRFGRAVQHHRVVRLACRRHAVRGLGADHDRPADGRRTDPRDAGRDRRIRLADQRGSPEATELHRSGTVQVGASGPAGRPAHSGS